LIFNISFSKKIGLQPEAEFQLKGKELEFNDRTMQDISFVGFNVSILLEYKVMKELSLHARPTLCFGNT
jgi:hypothetical protein